jgi:hypothetical protein
MTNPRIGLDDIDRRKGLAQNSFTIHPNGTYSKVDGTSYETFDQLVVSLKVWHWWTTADTYRLLMDDPDFEKYLEDDGSLLVPRPYYGKADVVYIPMKYADEYIEAAKLMLKYKIFLETGFSKIVDMIRQTTTEQNSNTTSDDIVVGIPIFTTWGGQNVRNSLRMFMFSNFPTSVIHPFKLSKGYKNWNYAFEWMTTSTTEFVYPSDFMKNKNNNNGRKKIKKMKGQQQQQQKIFIQ